MSILAETSNVTSRHWLRMPAPHSGENFELFIFTGIAVFDGQLKGTGGSWERGQAYINANYSNIVSTGQAILPQNWTVDTHLASISNIEAAINTGWAVDNFSLSRGSNHLGGGKVAVRNGILGIAMDVAVRDSDAYIQRLSYHVTILGKIVAYAAPPVK